jgi:MoxR-like ATPase
MTATASAPTATNNAANNAMLLMLQQVAASVSPENVGKIVDGRLSQHSAAIEQSVKNFREGAGKFVAGIEAAEKQFKDDAALTASNLDAMVLEAIERAVPRKLEIHVNNVLKATISGRVNPQFEKIVKRVAAGVNVLLVGPAGSGKSTIAEKVAEALGLRFGFISLTAGVSESRLVGKFAPTGANGSFEYIMAQFVDFYENGGLFIGEEGDSADANVMLTINNALANGHMETPNPAKPIIKRHPNFRFIMAANTWGNGADRQYVGRNQLDAATLDRFAAGKFAVDYDEELEREIAADHTEFVAWVHRVREIVRDNKIRRVVSTRFISDGVKCLAAGVELGELKESFLLDWSAQERMQVAAA